MSSAKSANSDQNSLEKQLTDKCSILSYFDKNISAAIQKLDEINERGKNAVANKSPIFSLMSSADEGLQVEAHNLYSQGLKYVFSIEEEPRFSWGALLVTCLGVLQIVAGVLLVTSTLGTFALAGVELITEGIADCIHGIHSMVKGDFSWKSWAVTKAISVGVSLFSFGVGKWIAKGFKTCKLSIKGFGARLMAKFLSRRTTASVVAKTTMRNTVIRIGKKMAEEIDTCGLGKEEEIVLEEILNSIKNVVKDGILKTVRSNMGKKPLATSVDLIILSHLKDKKQLSDLLKDKNKRSDLLSIFRVLSNTALQPFHTDVSWQDKLNSSVDRVLDRAKAEAPGTAQTFLTAVQDAHKLALARDAISVALSLSSDFFSNLKEQLNAFEKQNVSLEKVKVNELSASDAEMLKDFKQDLADTVGALLADALVEVFHQRFSRDAVSHVRGKVNGVIGRYTRTGLNSDRTEELLRAEQNNRYITYMPVDTSSRHEVAAETGENSRSHAEKITNPRTPGTLLDIRVLSEATGTNVVILTQDSNGRLIKLSELSPSTKPTSQTVTLIYRPQSAQYPGGHYDVQINTQTVSIVNEYRSCLFHAFARGIKPEASEREIALDARRLRFIVADALLSQPGQWEPFVKRKVQTEAIREGDWFMLKGSARKNNIEEFKEILEKKVGEIQLYKDWLEYKKTSRIGRLINADHQPPVNSLIRASQMKKKSRLLEAMLEVATNSSAPNNNQIARLKQDHGLELPTVLVPYQIHMQCPSTRSPAFRARLAEAISDGDVEGTFKLTIIGSMPKFKLKGGNDVKNFRETEESAISLAVFEESFQRHSKEMVEMWFNLLKHKGVMTETHLNNITDWINREGYNDQNDPYRDQVSKLL